MKTSITAIFLLMISFSSYSQIEKPKTVSKPTTKTTAPASNATTNSSTASVEILWTGQGIVNVAIGSVVLPVKSGVASTMKLKADETFSVEVRKPSKTYSYEDYIMFSKGKNYLQIDLVNEKLVLTNQNEEQHTAGINKSKSWDLIKDSILNREQFIRKKNKVKSCTTWKTNKDGKRYKYQEVQYDDAGRKLSGQTWNEDGSISSNCQYLYDENHNLIRFVFSGGTYNSTINYSYDQSGFLIQTTSEKSTTIYKNDSKGLVLENTTNGDYASRSSYYYNEQMQCTKIVSSGCSHEKDYDGKGNCISDNSNLDNGAIFNDSFQYDSNCLMIFKNGFYNSGTGHTSNEKEEYIYTYY